MTNYFDRQGKPIDILEWCRLHEDHDYCRVALDSWMSERGAVTVSTVWLGLDHSFGGRAPLIFESMVFGPGNEYQRRYSIEEKIVQARARQW